MDVYVQKKYRDIMYRCKVLWFKVESVQRTSSSFFFFLRNLVKTTQSIFRTNVNYFIQMYCLTKFRIQNESLRWDITLSQMESTRDYSTRACFS